MTMGVVEGSALPFIYENKERFSSQVFSGIPRVESGRREPLSEFSDSFD